MLLGENVHCLTVGGEFGQLVQTAGDELGTTRLVNQWLPTSSIPP